MASASEVLKFYDHPPDAVERIAHRGPIRLNITEPDPSWPSKFASVAQVIKNALGDRALCVEHVGSTSVQGLPAKNVIDVDLVVADPTDEESYVPALEAAGFQFLLRENKWYGHRFFGFKDPYTNLHVWRPDSPELVRHRLFRDWLRMHEEDRVRYAQVKRDASKAAQEAGETVWEYTARKNNVIRAIYDRIFHAHGFLKA